MHSNDASMEAALLAIAKELLEASDELAAVDPSAAAKLAHEAYEIGRDLGVVRDHLEEPVAASPATVAATAVSAAAVPAAIVAFAEKSSAQDASKVQLASSMRDLRTSVAKEADAGLATQPDPAVVETRRDADDESDIELIRILNRQKALLPQSIEETPVRQPSRDRRPMTFESAPSSRRTGWFGWMRPREWRHAG